MSVFTAPERVHPPFVNAERAGLEAWPVAARFDLDDVARRSDRVVDLRWIYVHLIEEYARRNGHADLLRECLDGATGD